MNNITEVLTEARELISDPKRWTQGLYARDVRGNYTKWNSPEAACWCSAGAIAKVVGASTDSDIEYDPIAKRAIKKLMYGINSSIYKFNDSHTHAEVLTAFDKVIRKGQA